MRSIILGGVWRWAVGCALLAVFSAAPAEAANPFSGTYNGYIYLSATGAGALSETPFTPVFISVNAAGALLESNGSFVGQVDNAGNITFSPNVYLLTTGTIAANTMAATGSSTNGATTITYRLGASFTSGTFVGSGALTWRTPSAGGGYLNAVTYGNGRFVAVGYGGTIATSMDGTNWLNTPVTTGRSELVDIAYGNNLFVSVSKGATAFTSPDGVAWTSRSPGQTFTGIAFGSGKFIAVNTAAAVYSSTDGIAWSTVAGAATGQSFTGVDYANNLFVLYGSAGSFQTSADGTTWNTIRSAGAGALNGVAYNAGRWVIGSVNRLVTFANSSGVDLSSTNTPYTVTYTSVAAGTNVFVAGTSYTPYTPAFSTNGNTWKFANGLNDAIRGVAFGSNVFVAVGNHIQSSADGKVWTIRSKNFPAAAANNNGSQYSPYSDEGNYTDSQGRQRVVRVGLNGVIETRFFNSAQGSLAFVPVDSPTTNHLRRVVSLALVSLVGDKGTIIQYNAASDSWKLLPPVTTADLVDRKDYVVVGSGGTILTGDGGGSVWNVRSSGTANNLNSINTASTGYIIGGDNGTILTSTDTINWTLRTTGATNKIMRVSNGDYFPSNFAFAENDPMLLTTNGSATWQPMSIGYPFKLNNAGNLEGGYTLSARSGLDTGGTAGSSYTAPVASLLKSVAYGNGSYVVVGGTTRAVSTNLVDWRAGASDYNANAITFGHGIFLAVGSDPVASRSLVDTSVDGLTWTRRAFPTNVGLTAVTFGQDRFVVTGSEGALYTSTNGITWEDRSFSNPSGSISGAAYGGGRFVVIVFGTGGTSLTRHSTNGVDWVAGATPDNVSSITYGNGLFVAVGSGFNIDTSTNGINWVSRRQFKSSSANGVAYGGGRFVVVGGKDTVGEGANVFSSIDAVNWLNETTAGSLDLMAVTAGKGNFVMVGDKSAVISAGFVETNSPALITGQPTPLAQNANAGATVVYAATVTGTATVSYRWLKNGTPLFDGPGISGAATASLSLTGVDAASAATYQLSVWNDAGSDLSQRVVLNVNAKPFITLQPLNTTTTNNTTTNLNVEAVGPAPLAFQWYQAGVPLTNSSYVFGANEKRVYFTTANRTNEANYFVVISNSFGSVTSAVVHVSVNRAPIVTQPPAAVTVFQGQPVLLSVVGDGTAPLAYQWKFNGSPIFNGTNQSYGYANGLVSSNGLYTVTITNLFGSVTSVAAAVTNIGPGVIRPDFNYTNTLVVQDIAATPDGNFLAAGSTTLTMLSGIYKFSLAGTAVSNLTGFQAINAYSPGFRTIGVLTDNSIVVGGSLEGSGSVAPRYTNLVRFLPNGQLDTTVRYPSSQIVQKIIPVAGGKFLTLRAPDVASSSAFIARYNLDGSADSSFTTLASGTGGYWGMGVQSNGTIWLGANNAGLQKANVDGTGLTTVDGNSAAGRVFVAPDDRIFYAPAPGGGSLLRRRNADGTTNTFNVTFNNSVYAMAFLPNGQILAGGNFNTVNGVSSPYLALLNDDGTRDPSFTSPFTYVAGAVNSILLLPDGSALVADGFSGAMMQRVQIYMPDLAFQKQPLAQTVNRTGTASFTAVATGNSTVSYQWRKNGVDINNATNATLTLVNVQDSAAGNYDVVASNLSGTRTSGTAALTVLGNVQFTLQPVSQTVLAGTSFTLSATATGATPITFQWRHAGTNIPGATSSTFTIPSAGTNDLGTYDVVAANTFSSQPSTPASLSVFANPAGIGGVPGTLDTNYFPAITNNGAATVLSVVLDANGKILLTGMFTNFAGQPRSSFARLNADLFLDTPAPILGTDPIPAIGLPGGGFALGGYFSTVNASSRYGLAFFDVNGAPLALPTLSTSGFIDGGYSKAGFALQSDGKVVFGGSFTTVNGTARKSIARVNADGSLDSGFVPATLNSDVTSVAIQSDGKVLVGGYFSTVNGFGQAKLARLNTNGTYDATFANTFTINTPYGFKFQSDGKIIIYGYGLTAVGGQTRYGIARLNSNGSLDTAFDANLGGVGRKDVLDVLVEPDDKLVIVGAFDTVGGITRKCVARLNANGALDTGFATGAGATASSQPYVYSVINLANGAYLIGGSFTSYDGLARPGLARLNGGLQPPPARAILQDPQSLTVVQGVTANFAVTATGTAPLTFQWRHAGTNLIGATNTSLSITNSQAVDVGTYDAVVTDATGSSTSQAATLSVQPAQIFATWVASFGLGTGQDATINDPDTDGLLNAVEFALGTHPSQGGAGQRPAALVKSVAGLFYPAVQFTRSRSATGVVIQVSASANVDFGTLLPLFETAQDLGNGLDLVTVRSQSPVGTYPSFFFHITALVP